MSYQYDDTISWSDNQKAKAQAYAQMETPQEQQPQEDPAPGMAEYRFKFGFCFWFGVLLCFTPLLPLGLGLALGGGFMLLISPKLEKLEVAMHEEARRTGGIGGLIRLLFYGLLGTIAAIVLAEMVILFLAKGG